MATSKWDAFDAIVLLVYKDHASSSRNRRNSPTFRRLWNDGKSGHKIKISHKDVSEFFESPKTTWTSAELTSQM